MIYELVKCTDPVLKTPTQPFDFDNPPVDPLDLVSDLAETMLANGGIGLAAPQCGLPYRVFVMLGTEIMPFFNPRIVHRDDDDILLEEGCLSYPGLMVKIKRARTIKVRYAEPNGNVKTEVFDGMTARIFQHELDHLDGIRYTDRANRIHLDRARNAAKKLKRKS